ncbi:Gfo/Idh/MocA family oxidoreductase [Inquilinus sp. CAU 1745]|uniref:Gfo/Idh/MocA family protein n=1 Tax=Inquilinus sp. CAU 1745 TaxID=3140369 RepID=UPI00325B0166
MDPITVGVIGCGNISDAYFQGARRFDILKVKACADLREEVAKAQAAKYGVQSVPFDRLLADPEIDLVVNLTVPLSHAAIGIEAASAGKHVYSEKPFAVTAEEARGLMAAAAEHGVRLGCAPDTFMGGAHQAARKLLDDGVIGRPVGGAVCVMSRGMEHWHPNPEFFFKRGGGPMLDVGPYYVTELVNLYGPVRRVVASASAAFPRRTVTSQPLHGAEIEVEVPTSVHGVLDFANGATVSLSASWDVWTHGRNPIEIYGTEGSMLVPDPNFFGGTPRVSVRGGGWEDRDISAHPFGLPNRDNNGQKVADYRAIGVVDMAWAIRQGRPHRANADLALHVLEVLEAFERSSVEGRHIVIDSACDRPAAIATGQGEEVFSGLSGSLLAKAAAV